jgi:hypothetical protein
VLRAGGTNMENTAVSLARPNMDEEISWYLSEDIKKIAESLNSDI